MKIARKKGMYAKPFVEENIPGLERFIENIK